MSMKKYARLNRFALTILSVFVAWTLAGCGSKIDHSSMENMTKETGQATTPSSDAQPYLTFTDAEGQKVVSAKKPERIVFLASEALNLFYQLGGSVVGYATSPGTPVPEAAKTAKNVGQVDSASLELIQSLKPDIVIGQWFANPALREPFASSNIPFALLKITNYEELQKAGRLFGQLIGKGEEAGATLDELDNRVQAIVSKLPKQSPTYAQVTLMESMGTYITKGGSMTSDIANRLNLKNAAVGMTGEVIPDYVPFSLEKLIDIDPEYLLINFHGDEDINRKILEQTMQSNPAYNSLRAVKENKVLILPSKIEAAPDLDIDKLFEKIAKFVYPNVYGA